MTNFKILYFFVNLSQQAKLIFKKVERRSVFLSVINSLQERKKKIGRDILKRVIIEWHDLIYEVWHRQGFEKWLLITLKALCCSQWPVFGTIQEILTIYCLSWSISFPVCGAT